MKSIAFKHFKGTTLKGDKAACVKELGQLIEQQPGVLQAVAPAPAASPLVAPAPAASPLVAPAPATLMVTAMMMMLMTATTMKTTTTTATTATTATILRQACRGRVRRSTGLGCSSKSKGVGPNVTTSVVSVNGSCAW